MKNIHVLPTEKPDRLYKVKSTCKLGWSEDYLQHIYITSDEEIKEGDYFLYDGEEIRYKTNGTEYHGGDLCHISGNRRYSVNESKKIILTTDQDLIKYGVQAIDDEFLEWFVKNPSCEFVKVKAIYDSGWNYGYKIIIPKEKGVEGVDGIECCDGTEEPKKKHIVMIVGNEVNEEPKQSTKERIISETSEETKQKARDYGNSLVNKQETLEEDKLRQLFKNRSNCYVDTDDVIQAMDENCFIETINEWQQEQNSDKKYSEEDMKKAFHVGKLNQGRDGDTSFEKFIEKFKNK